MEGYANNGSEHFAWGRKGGFQSKLPGFSSIAKDTTVEVSASYNEVEKKILQDANARPGGMQALFDRLYKAGLIKKQTYDTKAIETSDFTSGLMYALREYTKKTTGEFIDDLDKAELMRKVAGKALDGSDIDTVLKAGAGAAQAVNSVISNARNYGVKLSNQDALGYVANELKLGQGDLKKVNAKILAVAKSTYNNLSDTLSDEVSLKDLSSNYVYNMAEVLELNPKDIDALDPTIQTALKNAREEASRYAYEVLKDFGLMA